jgi:hypothetical protein
LGTPSLVRGSTQEAALAIHYSNSNSGILLEIFRNADVRIDMLFNQCFGGKFEFSRVSINTVAISIDRFAMVFIHTRENSNFPPKHWLKNIDSIKIWRQTVTS